MSSRGSETERTTARGVAPVPANVEAEAAFLGRVLSDPGFLGSVEPALRPADFYEPIHARIYACILDVAASGGHPNAVALGPLLKTDEGLQRLGGVGYLARLTGDAVACLVPDGFAGQIAELSARRRRMAWLAEEASTAADVSRPLSAIEVPGSLTPAAKPLASLDLVALADIEPEPKRFIIPRLAPAAEVTLFTGAGAVGKSLLAQQLATAIATGTSTLGLDLDPAPAIYITCEDDAKVLHYRQAHICRALGLDMANLAGWLHLISLRGEPDNALAYFDHEGRLVAAPLFARVAKLVRETRAALVCLDNVAHLFTGNENDRGNVTQFVNLLNRLAGETGVAMLLMGHPNKGGDTYSGSTGWLNAVRSQVYMSRLEEDGADPDVRTVTIGKPNYTQAGEALRFRWHNWAFVPEGLVFSAPHSSGSSTRASEDEKLFLACLAERLRQQRAVSEKRSPSFAPTVFATMSESNHIGKARLEAAMDRLFRDGQIERGELWKGPDRKPVFGLRETAGNGAGDTV